MKLPDDAWDSHVHVIDEEKFPFSPDYHYRPKKADLDDLLRFEKTLGIPNACIVSVSIYGTDNRSILDALERLQGKGRAVVTIDPLTIKDDELDHMHKLGVRAVRLNLASRGQSLSKADFSEVLQAYARRLKKVKWALQIYLHLPQLAAIAEEIPNLGIPVVIDHLAHPETSAPMSTQPGSTQFLSLLEQRLIYTKLSGAYRFPELSDLNDVVKEILRRAPTQVVWASDWPHTGGGELVAEGERTKLQDFRQVDDAAWIKQCLEWCNEDEDLARKIWVENPRRLWQVDA